MHRADRLRLTSKVCYYLGWLGIILVIIGHLTKFNDALSQATKISGRNVLEATLVLFLISIASELRAAGVSAAERLPAEKAKAQAV